MFKSVRNYAYSSNIYTWYTYWYISNLMTYESTHVLTHLHKYGELYIYIATYAITRNKKRPTSEGTPG